MNEAEQPLGDQSFHRVKAELFKELVATFDHYLVADLETIVDAIEEFLKRSLQRNLVSLAASFTPVVDPSGSTDIIIGPDSTLEVRIGEEILSNRTLDIAFVPQYIKGQKPRFSKKSLKYESSGRYSRFRVNWPVDTDVEWEELLQLVQAVVTTVYSWLEDSVVSKLLAVETELARELYSYARATFDCGDYLRRFWFIAVKDQKGYTLFDHRSILDIVSIAGRVARKSELAPSAITAHFVTNEADFELMVAKDAISLGKCIDVPFVKTKYCSVDHDFSSAEAAIHQAESITLFPLVREGHGFLLAGFPTPSRSIFEPLLTAHTAELVTLFNDRFRTIKQLAATLQKSLQGAPAGKIGEFFGGFTKALFLS